MSLIENEKLEGKKWLIPLIMWEKEEQLVKNEKQKESRCFFSVMTRINVFPANGGRSLEVSWITLLASDRVWQKFDIVTMWDAVLTFLYNFRPKKKWNTIQESGLKEKSLEEKNCMENSRKKIRNPKFKKRHENLGKKICARKRRLKQKRRIVRQSSSSWSL